MPFREIDRPDPSKILELPEEVGLVVTAAPSLQLFKDELTFWRTRKEEADRAGDAVTRRIAEEAVTGLRKAAMGRAGVELMLEQNAYDAEAVGDWFMYSTLATSHFRLLREVDQQPNPATLALGFIGSQVDVAIDFYEGDPHRSGVHAKPEYVRRLLAVEPPRPQETRYYEGDAIYLRATNPANPTAVFMEDFQAFYEQPFDPNEYVSVVPRLKTEFWTPQA